MEKIIKHRSYVVENSNNNYEYIEREIGCGQVEELIEQAKDELELIPVLLGTAVAFSNICDFSRA